MAAPGLAEGAPARAVVRAEALTLNAGVGARVLERRPHGAQDLVRVEAGGVVWRALISPRARLGEAVAPGVDAHGAFAFALE